MYCVMDQSGSLMVNDSYACFRKRRWLYMCCSVSLVFWWLSSNPKNKMFTVSRLWQRMWILKQHVLHRFLDTQNSYSTPGNGVHNVSSSLEHTGFHETVHCVWTFTTPDTDWIEKTCSHKVLTLQYFQIYSFLLFSSPRHLIREKAYWPPQTMPCS